MESAISSPTKTRLVLQVALALSILCGTANHGYLLSVVPTFGMPSSPIEALLLPVQHLKTPEHSSVPPLSTRPARINVDDIHSMKKCPQLFQSHLSYVERDIPPLRVSMVQLVGVWKNESLSQVMHEVHESNAQLLWDKHQIKSTAVTTMPPHITPKELNQGNEISRKEIESPAYWKPNIIQHMCQNEEPKPDLVYYLDADIVLVNPHVRVDVLWSYLQEQRSSVNESLEILFDSDYNGLNSGSFIVNCTSDFAMDFLELWDRVALDVAEAGFGIVDWLEQSSLHYLLQTKKWKAAKRPYVWDSGLFANYQSNHSLQSNQAILPTVELNQRIGLADPCSMSCLYKPSKNFRTVLALRVNGNFASGGSYAAHCAGEHDVDALRLKLRQAVMEAKNWPNGSDVLS